MKNTYLKKLLLFVLVTAIPPLLCSAVIINRYYTGVLRKNIMEKNTVLLTNSMEAFEEKVLPMKRDFLDYCIGDKKLAKLAKELEISDYYALYEICNDIQAISSRHTIVDNVIVYSKNNNFVISSYSTYNTEYYLEYFQTPSYKSLISGNHSFTCSLLPDITQGGSVKYDAIIYSYSLPLRSGDPDVLVSIVISADKAIGELQSSGLLDEGALTIGNSNADSLLAYALNDGIDLHTLGNGGRYTPVSLASEGSQLRYTIYIPADIVDNQVFTLSMVIYYCAALVAIFTLFAALYSVKLLYHPFELVSGIHDSMREEILDAMPVVQEGFLRKLLKAEFDEDSISDDLRKHYISFNHGNFTVIVFKATDEKTRAMIRDVFTRYCGSYRIVEEQELMVAIINHSNQKAAYEILNEDFKNVDIIAGVGNVVTDVSELPESYKNACHALESRPAKIGRRCTFFDNIADDNKEYRLLNDEVIEFIDQNYKNEISLEQIAERFCISYSYLSKIFKNETGICYVDYVNDKRIREAQHIFVDDPSISFEEIASRVGYRNVASFGRNFKNITGITAAQFRSHCNHNKNAFWQR